MQKTNKNNDAKKIFITLAIIILILLIAGGATFSYWFWEVNTAQQTNINITTTGGTLTISGDNVENIANGTAKGMYPTNDCDGPAALVGEEVTITAKNNTERIMKVIPRLDIKVTTANGRTLSDSAKSHLHWALVETTNTTTKTCSNPDYTGTFNKVAKITLTKSAAGDVTITGPTVEAVTSNGTTTINITNMSSNNNVTGTLLFDANPLSETTKKYKLFVWLDSTYTYTNVGDTISDPMQELAISVKWSANSTMVQEELLNN